ncbi:hypothetical protein TSAR_005502, partial [Trichomalopsis sarcophagae]
GRCLVSGNKHHTKLHQEGRINAATATADDAERSSTSAHTATESSLLPKTSSAKVLLSTSCAILQAPNGQAVTVRVQLDSGVEESFISERIVQLLGLHKHTTIVAVSGVGGTTTAVARARVTATLKSNYDANFRFDVTALVQKLTSILSRTVVTMQDRDYLQTATLAKPHFDQPANIDCVLSSAVYAAVLRPGIKRESSMQPVTLNFTLGWILMESIDEATRRRTLTSREEGYNCPGARNRINARTALAVERGCFLFPSLRSDHD